MVRSFSMTSRTTCSLNSSEYLAAGMGSILSTHGKKNSPQSEKHHAPHPTTNGVLEEDGREDEGGVRDGV